MTKRLPCRKRQAADTGTCSRTTKSYGNGIARSNTPLIELILPRLESEAREIKLTALRVQNTRRAYWPKWAVVALETAIILSDESQSVAQQMMGAYRHGNYRLLNNLSVLINRYSQKIEQAMAGGPPPTEQGAMRQMVNEVLEGVEWE